MAKGGRLPPGQAQEAKPSWAVKFATRKIEKDTGKLPSNVQELLAQLFIDIADTGPSQPEWPNYGKLKRKRGQAAGVNRHHCHLKKGHPTYVAIWRETEKTVVVEVIYVGTHEGANKEY